jgi:hypothetical protein
MSSGTIRAPGLARQMLMGIAEKFINSGSGIKPSETSAQTSERIKRLGLSPRQQELNYLWSVYRCAKYAARAYNWDGSQSTSPIEHEAIATQVTIPPGFVDAGAQMMPVKFRKPTAPYALGRVIVDRFTGLLFSEKRHPTIKVEGDPKTEDYVNALVDSGRLWARMIKARTFGGAVGTAVIGFQFVAGKVMFETFDPRWCEPAWLDRSTFKLKSIEIRYMYPQEERDVTGVWKEIPYWYRRTIDIEADTLYAPAPVGDGEEPDWQAQKQVKHGLGFCPVVWIQNQPLDDDIDGDPDCLGAFEMIDAIDTLLSSANGAIIANTDPTVVISTDAKNMVDVKKGNNNAIKVEKGGGANYMEISATGPKAAEDLADKFRAFVLEVTQCVLDASAQDASARTATEIERKYAAMIAKADVLREQYGQNGIILLCDMLVAAVRKAQTTVTTDPETGKIVRQVINLPKKKVVNEETGEAKMIDHELGEGGMMSIQWPHYFEPLLADIDLAVRAAVAAVAGKLIDIEHAARFVAEYFRVEDIHMMLDKIKSEVAEREEAMASRMFGGSRDDNTTEDNYSEEGAGDEE